MNKVLNVLTYPIKIILLLLIKIYKIFISPLLPDTCKYTPTCSTYGYISIKRFGVFKGSLLTAKRVASCNPYSEGGFDPVKDNIKGEIKWLI